MPTPLAEGARVTVERSFHVELLRGGMNRLLLRALPTSEAQSRVEVLFQYVQHLDVPMSFGRLVIDDVTDAEAESVAEILERFPECRVYRVGGGARPGRIVAAACVVGEDHESPYAESMFPMMT